MTIDKSWTLLHKNSIEFWNGLQIVLQENICNDHDVNIEPAEGPSATNIDLDDLFTLANTELYPGFDWMSSLDFLRRFHT